MVLSYKVDLVGVNGDVRVAMATDILREVWPSIAHVTVDAYTDYSKLTPGVQTAQRYLRELGQRLRSGHRGDHWMAVSIKVHDDEEWAALVEYAPWSIHVEAVGSDGTEVYVAHDGAQGVAFNRITPAVLALANRHGLVIEDY